MAKIGVLALQGAFREHCAAVRRVGHEAIEVRTPADLAGVDALIIPGGESTTMDKLLDWQGLREPLQERLHAGMPTFGTCAGLIVLAASAVDGLPDQRPLAAIDYYRLHEGSYSESGGGNAFDLSVDGRNSDELAASATVSAGFDFGSLSPDSYWLRAELEGQAVAHRPIRIAGAGGDDVAGKRSVRAAGRNGRAGHHRGHLDHSS